MTTTKLPFGAKTCKYNINSMEDIFESLDDVCNKSNSLTDIELSSELSNIYSFCMGGKSGKDFYFITHGRSNKLVEKRAKKYCKKNNINLEDYNGSLPYSKFIVDLSPDLKRKDKLKKISDNIKGIKHTHIVPPKPKLSILHHCRNFFKF